MSKLDALIERARALPEDEQAALAELIEDFLDPPIEIPESGPGSDEELRQRIAEWEANPVGVPGDEVFRWIESLASGDPLPPPKPRKLT